MDNKQILPKKILKFTDEAEDDFALNELNIREKALSCSTLKVKWLRKLFTEQSILKKVEQLVDAKKLHFVTTGDPNVPQFQREIDVNNREDIQLLQTKIKEQREVIRFVEGVLKIAATFNFDLKNSIDYIKLSE